MAEEFVSLTCGRDDDNPPAGRLANSTRRDPRRRDEPCEPGTDEHHQRQGTHDADDRLARAHRWRPNVDDDALDTAETGGIAAKDAHDGASDDRLPRCLRGDIDALHGHLQVQLSRHRVAREPGEGDGHGITRRNPPGGLSILRRVVNHHNEDPTRRSETAESGAGPQGGGAMAARSTIFLLTNAWMPRSPSSRP